MLLPHSSYPLLAAVFLITRSDVCSIEIGCMGVHSDYFSTYAPFLFISFFFFILDIAVNNQPRCLRGVFHHIFNVKRCYTILTFGTLLECSLHAYAVQGIGKEEKGNGVC